MEKCRKCHQLLEEIGVVIEYTMEDGDKKVVLYQCENPHCRQVELKTEIKLQSNGN